MTSLLRERYPDVDRRLREAAAPEAGGPVDWRERLAEAAGPSGSPPSYGATIEAGLRATGQPLGSTRSVAMLSWAEEADRAEERGGR